jgi:N-acetylneuraminate synthase
VSRYVQIGTRRIGPGEPTYIIAEIGANHNGDMVLAREMISAAKECGADAVKFQLWGRYTAHTESYIQQLNRQTSLGRIPLTTPELGIKNVSDQLEKFQCTPEQHIELKEYADKLQIDFASTALTEPDVKFLRELGVAFLKIASQDTDHPYFIEFVARQNHPVMLSTGLSNWGEIEQAVNCFKPDYLDNLIVLHCVAVYPPSDDEVNLAKIETLRGVCGVPVGFSDHSIGFAIPLAAIARGADVLEKHFTLDKNMPGWDQKVSADPTEMQIICREGKRIRAAIGIPGPDISPAELKNKDHYRRSIVTTQPIRQGELITMEKLFFKRPGTGIKPYELKYVLNRVAKRDIPADELVLWEDLV